MLEVRRPLGGLRLVARFFSNRPRAAHLFEEKWSSHYDQRNRETRHL
jgi:hypothetical protein